VVPLGYAARITISLAQSGYLNTNGSPYCGCLAGLIVLCATYDPMQHLIISIWHVISAIATLLFQSPGSEFADLDGVAETAFNFKAPDTALAAKTVNKSGLVTMSPTNKEKCWVEATHRLRKWKQMVVEMLSEIPEVQC
jgi:hypothetical protein